MFKIRMIKTVKLLGTWPTITFHKGTSYLAYDAINQPDWRAKRKVFVEKGNGESMLLEDGDYTAL